MSLENKSLYLQHVAIDVEKQRLTMWVNTLIVKAACLELNKVAAPRLAEDLDERVVLAAIFVVDHVEGLEDLHVPRNDDVGDFGLMSFASRSTDCLTTSSLECPCVWIIEVDLEGVTLLCHRDQVGVAVAVHVADGHQRETGTLRVEDTQIDVIEAFLRPVPEERRVEVRQRSPGLTLVICPVNWALEDRLGCHSTEDDRNNGKNEDTHRPAFVFSCHYASNKNIFLLNIVFHF